MFGAVNLCESAPCRHWGHLESGIADQLVSPSICCIRHSTHVSRSHRISDGSRPFQRIMQPCPEPLQAVCSFQQRQLVAGGPVPGVLFFHGLAGLENACDDGDIDRRVHTRKPCSLPIGVSRGHENPAWLMWLYLKWRVGQNPAQSIRGSSRRA